MSCQAGWAARRSCSDGTEEDRENWWGKSCSPLRFHNPPAGGARRVQAMIRVCEESIKVKRAHLSGGPAERLFHHKHGQHVHSSRDGSVIAPGSQQQQEHIHLVYPGRSIMGGGRKQAGPLLRHFSRALFNHNTQLHFFFRFLSLNQSMNSDDFLHWCSELWSPWMTQKLDFNLTNGTQRPGGDGGTKLSSCLKLRNLTWPKKEVCLLEWTHIVHYLQRWNDHLPY